MSYERLYLPALVCSAVVGVVFGDVGINATQSQLFVWGRRDSLDYQLCIGIGWLGLILEKQKTGINKHFPGDQIINELAVRPKINW